VRGAGQSAGGDDCVAGHVRFELRNVAANYLFERSHKFPESSRILAAETIRVWAAALRRRSNARRAKNAPAISPGALEAVKRIDALFDIERNINGLSAEERLRVRQEWSAPILAALEALLREERSRLSRSASVAKPIELALALLGLGDGGGVDRSLCLRQTGSVATAITSPAKNALMQKNIRILSTLVMASPSSNWGTRRWREGGALAIVCR
jgi:hypothetical protein